MTKEQEYYFNLFIKSKPKTLKDVYKKPSVQKRRIWEAIKAGCDYISGFHLTVLTHNAQFFTAAYAYYDHNNVVVAVFTPSKTFDIVLPDYVFESFDSVKKWGRAND